MIHNLVLRTPGREKSVYCYLFNIWINAYPFNVYYTQALLVWINYYPMALTCSS